MFSHQDISAAKDLVQALFFSDKFSQEEKDALMTVGCLFQECLEGKRGNPIDEKALRLRQNALEMFEPIDR